MSISEVLRYYAEARLDLNENQIEDETTGVTWETAEFLRLNRRVCEAELAIPWWIRWAAIPVIDARIEQETDFWNRVRGEEQ